MHTLVTGRYLVQLATNDNGALDFTEMDHSNWREEAKRRHRQGQPPPAPSSSSRPDGSSDQGDGPR